MHQSQKSTLRGSIFELVLIGYAWHIMWLKGHCSLGYCHLILHGLYLTISGAIIWFGYAKWFSSSHSFNLGAGIAVAYSAPTRHGCLKVVENNYCASKRGMLPPSLLPSFPPPQMNYCIHYTSVAIFYCFITYDWTCYKSCFLWNLLLLLNNEAVCLKNLVCCRKKFILCLVANKSR